jgi:hypothetical protein
MNKKNPKPMMSAWGFAISTKIFRERFGRSSDSWILLLTAPSRDISFEVRDVAVVFCGVRPHTQRRVRAGIAPASLFSPVRGHRNSIAYGWNFLARQLKGVKVEAFFYQGNKSKRPTSNIQRPTSNTAFCRFMNGLSVANPSFDVLCSKQYTDFCNGKVMFDSNQVLSES